MKTNGLARLPPYRFDQSEKLWAILLAAGSLYVALFAYVPGFEKFGWPCLWKTCTGIECAGCGFTRACAALLAMNWKTAWSLNPLVFLIVPYLGWRAANIAIGLLTRRSVGAVVPARIRVAMLLATGTLVVYYALSSLAGQIARMTP